MKVGPVMGGPGIFTGGRGAWVINFDKTRALHIGGGGYGLTTKHLIDDITVEGETPHLAFGYGGLELGYVNRSNRLLHLTAQTLIGAGGAMYRDREFRWDRSETPDPVFVMEPEVGAELNLTTFARLTAGISYRWISGLKLDGVQEQDLNGFNGVFSIVFGSF